MKRIYSTILLLITAALPAFSQEYSPVNADEETAVRNIVMAIPEVKAKDKVYDSITNRMQRMLLHITPPDSAEHLYKVEAGYQGNNRFQPHFYLYIDLSGKMVYIEDLEKGDRTTLDEWRRRRAIASPN